MKLEVTVVPDELDEDGEPTFMEVDRAVAALVAPKAMKHVEGLVEKQYTEELRANIQSRVATQVTELFAKGVPQTDRYGQPKGDPTTMVELILKEATKYLEGKVNLRGESQGYGDNCVPRLLWAARQAAQEAVKALVDKHLAEMKRAFSEKVSSELARIVSKV